MEQIGTPGCMQHFGPIGQPMRFTTKHTPFSLVFEREALLPMAPPSPWRLPKTGRTPASASRHSDGAAHSYGFNQTWSRKKHETYAATHERKKTSQTQGERDNVNLVTLAWQGHLERRLRNKTLEKRILLKLWRKVRLLEATKMGNEDSTPKKQFYPTQQIFRDLRHRVPGQGKFKIRWAGPNLIQQVYDNGWIRNITTLQGDRLGRVNMNKLKPCQEPQMR